jgi:transposase
MSDIEDKGELIEKRARNKAAEPRFQVDISGMLDPVLGCPEQAIPKSHLARAVKTFLAGLDFSTMESKYSSQGRHGFHPRHVFGALLYGSLIGVHTSTRLAETLRWDLALRLVAGGHSISAGLLRAFKRSNGDFFRALQQQLLKVANERGLLALDQLAVDSVRLRADASVKAVRTLKRSMERLRELGEVDASKLSPGELEAHSAKVKKHSDAIEFCQQQERTNYVTTSPGAGLMKFPDGAAAPGHRATVVAAGVKERFIVDVLVDSASNDIGKLGPAIVRARRELESAGVPLDEPMQVAGDAGYFCTADLAFASKNRAWVDVLIAEYGSTRRSREDGAKLFGVDAFRRNVDGKMVCPAQKLMEGPGRDGERERWTGNGCATCGLKSRCTNGALRTLTIDTAFHDLRDAMRERMQQPNAKERYGQRIATVEPVFSKLEHGMGFRRVTSRCEPSVQAEILLKVLAYNVKRLIQVPKTRAVAMLIDEQRLAAPEEGD